MPQGPFGRAAQSAGVEFGSELIEQMEAYVALLSKHGARANLVGTTDRERIADEIVLDAARLAPLVKQTLGAEGRFIDIGSGAGIPCIPLLIALGGWQGVAVEPREKRRAFMTVARRELGMRDRFEIVDGRLEDSGVLVCNPHVELRFDLAVAKAVFEPDEWVRRAHPLLHTRGMVGVWLGESSKMDRNPINEASYTTAAGANRRVALVPR